MNRLLIALLSAASVFVVSRLLRSLTGEGKTKKPMDNQKEKQKRVDADFKIDIDPKKVKEGDFKEIKD